MTWRYQPIIDEHGVRLHEVYLSKDKTLDCWTVEPPVPWGTDVDDLVGVLMRMLCDVKRWRPVGIENLKTGSPMEEAYQQNDIEKYIDEKLEGRSRIAAQAIEDILSTLSDAEQQKILSVITAAVLHFGK